MIIKHDKVLGQNARLLILKKGKAKFYLHEYEILGRNFFLVMFQDFSNNE